MDRQRVPDPNSMIVLSERVEEVCSTLRALANETRLRILCVLSAGELPVGQIADSVGQSLSAVSQHLARLKSEGLVSARRDGQTIFYCTTDGIGTRIIQTLCTHYEV